MALRKAWQSLGLSAVFVLLSCAGRQAQQTGGDGVIAVTVNALGTPVATLVVTTAGPGIAVPIVDNITIGSDGIGTGTLHIPPGTGRTITVKAFDTDGSLAYEGSVTINVISGENPAVSIPMLSSVGLVPIKVQIGNVSLVVSPATTTLSVGATLQLTARITAVNGETIMDSPRWATTNPAIVTVDTNGLVTGMREGQAEVAASYAGIASVCMVTVSSGSLTVFAGVPSGGGYLDGSGPTARFASPFGVAVDGSGNVYVAERLNNTIRKITPAGVVSTLAGAPGQSGSSDGTGPAARFNAPQGVAVDGSGNVYVADTGNHVIRKITPAGVVSTLAGAAGQSGSADGTGSAATFNWPEGVAADGAGNVYVADLRRQTTVAALVFHHWETSAHA